MADYRRNYTDIDQIKEDTRNGYKSDLDIKATEPDDKDVAEEKTPPRADVLREAEHLITGDRNHTYGSPTQNFVNIGEMWTTRLRHKLAPGERLTATDVADLMVLLKVARNITQPKRDNFVDGAGYFACGYEAFLNEN